jgi:PAS domain S-box-containing protein
MSTLAPYPTADIADLHPLVPFYQAILDTLPAAVGVFEIVTSTDFRVAFMNRMARESGYAATTEIIGKRLDEIMPAATVVQVTRRFQDCIERDAAQTIEDSYQLPNSLMWTTSTFVPIRDVDGRITHILSTWKDITADKQRALAEQQRQDELIDQQTATLAEMSTPLLTISDTTVVMPLVGAVDSRRVSQIMDTLLQGVSASRASIVILDITGVSVVDTQVADAFIRASQAVSLLGAQVVLTGIRPEVAQTLVQLGVDLRSIITRGTLQDGITYALRK